MLLVRAMVDAHYWIERLRDIAGIGPDGGDVGRSFDGRYALCVGEVEGDGEDGSTVTHYTYVE